MWDRFSLKSKRIMKWRAGVGKKIKSRANKQVRQQGKKETKDDRAFKHNTK